MCVCKCDSEFQGVSSEIVIGNLKEEIIIFKIINFQSRHQRTTKCD